MQILDPFDIAVYFAIGWKCSHRAPAVILAIAWAIATTLLTAWDDTLHAKAGVTVGDALSKIVAAIVFVGIVHLVARKIHKPKAPEGGSTTESATAIPPQSEPSVDA